MNLFEHLSGLIVRPSRHDYRIGNLGVSSFEVKRKTDGNTLLVNRQDRCFRNRNGYRLHMSHYCILPQSNHCKPQTVIYLHSNNGSRVEGLGYLRYLLENELNVVLFDFSGSGMSEGEFVTLGLRQSEDVEDVIELLTNEGKLGEFALWGRSMGAVTALLYCSRNNRQPNACVYDSPFSSLQQLIQQLATSKTGIPEFLVGPLLSAVERTLQQQVKVNFSELRIRDRVHLIRCPGLFLTSKKDRLVHHQHCQQLYKLYPTEKRLEFIDCEHHETRSKETIKLCINFLKAHFEGCQHSPKLGHQNGIGITLVERTESLRRIDIENLNINIMRTPTSFGLDGDRPPQTSRHCEDEPNKMSVSPGQVRKIIREVKQPEQQTKLRQLVQKAVHPKISLTQLKGKQPRATQIHMRSHQGGSNGHSHKNLIEEDHQKLPLSKAANLKKGIDRMVASEKLQTSANYGKMHTELVEGDRTVRRLHYKHK